MRLSHDFPPMRVWTKRVWASILIPLIVLQVTPPAFAEMEAGSCVDCTLPAPAAAKEVATDVKALTSIVEKTQDTPAPKCAEKGFLIDPEKRSILKEFDLDYTGSDPFVIAGRSSLSCFYGAMSGGYNSLKDLVLALPRLLGLSWEGMKSLGQKIGETDFSSWLDGLTPQKVWDKTKGAFEVTAETAKKAYNSASEFVYEAYEQGGVAGSLAAVAQAAYASSPHKVIGRFLADTGVKIARAIGKEWSAFACLDPEAMTEMVCKVAGYIATDILTGKVILSALTQTAKIAEALKIVRSGLERRPIIGEWLLRNLKRTETSTCSKIPDKAWKIDAHLKTQNQDVEVALEGGKILARGIDPKTGAMGCFEVVGKLGEQILARIQSTTKRVAVVESEIKNPAGTQDFFSAHNTDYARNSEDFVGGVNERAGVSISKKDGRAVAAALEKEPAQMEKYGDLHRTIDQMKSDLKKLPKDSPDAGPLSQAIAKAEESLQSLNRTLANVGSSERVNLNLMNQALNEAYVTKNTESVTILNRALYEFNKAAKGASTKGEKAWQKWEDDLLKNRPHLTKDDVKKARQCLFEASPGTR